MIPTICLALCGVSALVGLALKDVRVHGATLACAVVGFIALLMGHGHW